MNIYMDASGNAVANSGGPEKQYFVLAGVAFHYNSPEQEDQCVAEIKALLQKTGGRSFHYANDRNDRRLCFLKAISKYKYRYAALVFWNDRQKLEAIGVRTAEDQYRIGIAYVLEAAIGFCPYPRIVVDRDLSQDMFEKMLPFWIKHANKKIERNRIDGLTVASATEQPGIQIADYVAGILRDSLFLQSLGRSDGKSREYIELLAVCCSPDIQIHP